ncbi:hypothetical protein OR590_005842 [Pseudomonas aeruginosa]|nr:hypothetical protein [Pseudomonas aeruginosa]EKD5500606.1 hypothetical protein [Pseudomonas aeruginosa]EKD5528886.1 hypothetical protein [Pseudomonas aeruginosa]EKD5565952.1 hypothetical protein [Pseudomonas aeruginosa]EKD5597730.1 hypothetical protein [Pseudomonas aeruginosa]
MNDRELLELAARAAGMQINEQRQAERDAIVDPATASLWIVDGCTAWNSLTDDGDALRLAVLLNLEIHSPQSDPTVMFRTAEHDVFYQDTCIRRAIVRAAAEIGKSM